ncbi:hypothetical protein KEM56_006825 [Ascosphaera pollenicola]|nr:hypothetical protein KEM56_006825 [Ascosphaera pollenicola]
MAAQISLNEKLRGETPTLVPFRYQLLPLGTIAPRGWLKDQLELAANGLAGHLFEFYRFVQRSSWVGGDQEYSSLNEAAPYWYNGIVPLAFGLDDDRLKGQARAFLDYILSHQAEDGWIGPEKTAKTRGIWARCLVFRGLRAHAEAEPSRKEEIVSAMMRFTRLAHGMLKDDYRGYKAHEGDLYDTGKFVLARPHELSLSLQWLYNEVPSADKAIIWETMNQLWKGSEIYGRDWSKFFVDGVFPKEPSVLPSPNFQHGVNVAQGLRYTAQKYRMTASAVLAKRSREAVDMLFKYHGTPTGSFTSDEYLGGRDPNRGTELCTAIELMFSLSYMHCLFGGNDLADKVETATFNAMFGGIASDWWSHQYLSQANQPWCKKFGEEFALWYDCGPYANVFGLEPDYPCCLVNHHAGLPKILSGAFVKNGPKCLQHRFLVPCCVKTVLPGDNHVMIEAKTEYPFGHTIKYACSAYKPFDLEVRLPEWASSFSSMTIEDDDADAVVLMAPDSPPNASMRASLPPGISHLTVTLDLKIRIVPREHGAVAIYYGPLLYALEIAFDKTSFTPTIYGYNEEPLTDIPDPDGKYKHVRDHYLVPKAGAEWAVAIDTDQIRVHHRDTTELKSPIFAPGNPPTYLSVAAVKIHWPLVNGTAAAPPQGEDIKKEGEPFVARFVPFASAPLHMAELPTVKLPKLSL